MNQTQDYQSKLRDPRWQRRRLEKMEAAGWQCEICSDTDTELHVHHPWYEKEREPWDYPLEFLRCLCSHCHDLAHLPVEKVIAFAQRLLDQRQQRVRPPDSARRQTDLIIEVLKFADEPDLITALRMSPI